MLPIGLCGRLDTLQAAILIAKWTQFSWEVEQRQRVALNYYALLDGNADSIQLLTLRKNRQSVFGQFTLKTTNRDQLQQHLKRFNIPTAVHYPVPVNRQPGYQHVVDDHTTPVADWLSKHVLSLPMGPYLKERDQENICFRIKEFKLQTASSVCQLRDAA